MRKTSSSPDLVLILITTLLFACGTGRNEGRGRDSTSGPGFVDKERDINPNPADNTRLGLEVLRQWLEKLKAKNGSFPQSLAEIVPPDTVDPNFKPYGRFQVDGWNRPFRYRAIGTGFEIRSLGPDGVLSSDDIWVRQEGDSAGPPSH
jgi:hypothetical protein